MLSDKEVKDIMFDLERSEQLLQYQVEGVSLYYSFRFSIEILIRKTHNNKQKKTNNQSIIKRVYNKINHTLRLRKINEVLKKANKGFDSVEDMKPSSILFVGTSAWVNEEGSNVDLYDIIKYYHSKGVFINFIQPKYQKVSFPKKSKYYHTFLPIELNGEVEISIDIEKKLTDFVTILTKKTGVDFFQYYQSYYYQLKQELALAKQLEKYIRNSKCEYVFGRSLYTEPWITRACKKTNVKLVEVQHGVVTKDNIYFQSELGEESINKGYLLMPDYMLMLGNAWEESFIQEMSFFRKDNVFSIGTSDFQKTTSNKLEKTPKRIVFFLQGGVLGEILSVTDFIKDFIHKYKKEIIQFNLKIVVRPHPSEIEVLQIFSKKMLRLINIEYPKEVKSKDSIIKSDVIVSATSMCLYEALAYGKIAISFGLFQGMLSGNHIKIINNSDELFQIIRKINLKKQISIPYLVPFNPNVLNTFLKGNSIK